MAKWDPVAVKAQLRATAQKLGQLQQRKDGEAKIKRRDIATLLQTNIGIARDKAQNLIQEEILGNVLEILEMQIGVILERIVELEPGGSPSPILVEASSSIIYAAPYMQSKDLDTVRDILAQRLGPDFARSAVGNRDNHVSSRVIRTLSAPPPSAAIINNLLNEIAKAYGVAWTPEPQPREILDTLSGILDPTSSPLVDLPRLRKLCSQGIPNEPPWLRPRIWKLFFGILPVLKASWEAEIRKERESYYDLIGRLLEPFSTLPEPAQPLTPMDASLLSASKLISRVPPSLFSGLAEEPVIPNLSPLEETAPSEIRISCASNLDSRLAAIRAVDSAGPAVSSTPEIRLEPELSVMPEISLSTPDSMLSGKDVESTTLLSSKVTNGVNVHEKHFSALLRLLYLHSCINPANQSPHLPSLLIPLYTVLIQEIEPQELAHAEADTFWLFEAFIGEFSELEDEETGSLWMRRFSERLKWADLELAENLHLKGLDPALPHYSYRWLAPILTQTLPLPSVYLLWDALFSRPPRQRDTNPKLDYLLDFCTGMLIRARPSLLRLGKPSQKSVGLWVDENHNIPPPSPIRAWELGDAFLEGMSLLQRYPIQAAGGIDRLLQTASELSQRREEEAKAQKGDNRSLGARLKVSLWKGFTNQVSGPVPEEEEEEEEEESSVDGDGSEEGNETETPAEPQSPGLTSRLATTVWRGITNQSSMDAPPSPLTPSSPATTPPPPPASPLPESSPSSPLFSGASGIWNYAEKLKDSNAAATFAKVSSNWRAKAMIGGWGNRGTSAQHSVPSSPDVKGMAAELPRRASDLIDTGSRPASVPIFERRASYSPPQRPAFFKSPRDSMLPQPRKGPLLSTPNSPESAEHEEEGGLIQKTLNLQASLAALTRSQTPTPAPAPKAGPRPLLLGSSSVVVHQPQPVTKHAGISSTLDHGQWSDVIKAKTHSFHRDSQSSISSLSPSDALSRPLKLGNRSDWESDRDSTSRVVRLNRRSVSPMAPLFRRGGRPDSVSSSGTLSDRDSMSPTTSRYPSTGSISPNSGRSPNHPRNGSNDFYSPYSPPIISTPNPKNPTPLALHDNGALQLPASADGDHAPSNGVSRAGGGETSQKSTATKESDASDSSTSHLNSRSPRVRSKRQPPRPANLRIQETRSRGVAEQKTPSPSSLAPDWPDIATTPKAGEFDNEVMSSASSISARSPRRVRKVSPDSHETRIRKVSTDGHDARPRKISTESRTRKVSTDGVDTARRRRNSAADEGDDEGYDDLLSAYESEEGVSR